MAEIQPFHGVYYNQTRVKDLAAVICPPYDVIPSAMQQELYQQHDYNFIRLECARELPEDKETENRYTRAAATLEQWLGEGILETGGRPAIYLHDHIFSHGGKEYCRRGITCLVKLEDWEKMVVRPHEGTLSRPKSDRLSLLWALQADTSPVLSLFEDKERVIYRVLKEQSRSQPMADIKTPTSEGHRLWEITDTAAIKRIQDTLAEQPLYIADGHHRYESALNYQRERRSCSPSEKVEPYDYVMMNLVDFTDPGLIVLPAHRLARGIAKPNLDGLMDRLKTLLDVEAVPLDAAGIERQVSDLLAGKAGDARMVMYGLDREHLFILRLRDYEAVSQMMPHFHSELYRKLDVSIVDHVILEELLELNHEMAGISIAYSHDGPDAVKRVIDQEYQLVFIINPVRPETVKAIADIGDRMPRKSTYFYPKTPVGLVFYRFG